MLRTQLLHFSYQLSTQSFYKDLNGMVFNDVMTESI